MRLIGLSLALPFLVAACGQTLTPLKNFDAGFTDDLSAGGGGSGGTSKDMAGAKGDLAGVDGGDFDTTGPTIVINSPAVGDFVSGFFTVSADVSDPSGVNPSSVIAEFGNNASSDITLTQTMGNTYEGTFDVHTLAKDYVLATISVRAKDTLGNLSQLGEEVVVDIAKPWMTMNSAPTMRVSKTDSTAMKIECSQPFSPIGTDAAHEGQVVQQLITLRTRIEDHGNDAPGLALERISTVDPATVQMFVIHDDAQTVLAVDTDNDGYCDDVNPLLIPTAGPVVMQNEALSVQMVPMTAGGTPDFTQSGATLEAGCGEYGDASTTTAPKALCTDAAPGFSYELQYAAGMLPAIWTLPPFKSGDLNDCVGFQLDAANQLPEGPACVITRAADKAGNVEVSFPLHICIDMGGGKCSGFTPTMAHCTGVFDKTTMMLTPGTCTPPPQFSLATTPDGPNTFPTDGSEVKFIGP